MKNPMASSQLAIYRRKKGLTQEQLADLSGVTARTIQRIEKGSVVPHIQTLKMLADCLGVETEVLMDAPEGNLTVSSLDLSDNSTPSNSSSLSNTPTASNSSNLPNIPPASNSSNLPNTPTASNSSKAPLAPLFHLLALGGLFFPILNLVLPFALWLIKRHENPEYDKQGRQVMNFHLTTTPFFFAAIILMVYFFPIGAPLLLLIYCYMVLMSLVNLYWSVKSQPVKYPWSYPFFKVIVG